MDVFSWNVLADKWCTPESFPEVPPEVTLWKNRRPQIVSVLKVLAAAAHSFICLQEVDHYAELREELSETHEGHFMKKVGARYADGCCIFAPKGSAVEWRSVRLGKSPQVAVLLRTQHFLLVSTHLKAGRSSSRFGPARAAQLKMILSHCAQYGDNVPTVICGDFNEPPMDNNIMYLMKAAGFAPAYGDSSEVPTHNACIFVESFMKEPEREPHRLDYIFTRGVHVDSVEPFDMSSPHPTLDHPSDHAVIGARLSLLSN